MTHDRATEKVWEITDKIVGVGGVVTTGRYYESLVPGTLYHCRVFGKKYLNFKPTSVTHDIREAGFTEDREAGSAAEDQAPGECGTSGGEYYSAAGEKCPTGSRV